MTNGDYLRSLKDEDLVYYLMASNCPEGANCGKYVIEGGGRNCEYCWLDWLKQEAEVRIEVGDEVTAEDGGAKFIVTWMSDICVAGVDTKGSTYSYLFSEIDGKTGRHFSYITEALERIREDEE